MGLFCLFLSRRGSRIERRKAGAEKLNCPVKRSRGAAGPKKKRTPENRLVQTLQGKSAKNGAALLMAYIRSKQDDPRSFIYTKSRKVDVRDGGVESKKGLPGKTLPSLICKKKTKSKRLVDSSFSPRNGVTSQKKGGFGGRR